jgi:hypothetical protein
MDLNYGGWGRDSDARFDLNSYAASGDELPESPRIQDNIGGSTLDRITYQADFANPIGERSKLEYGAKANYVLDHTYLDIYLTNPGTPHPLAPTKQNDLLRSTPEPRSASPRRSKGPVSKVLAPSTQQDTVQSRLPVAPRSEVEDGWPSALVYLGLSGALT